MILCSRCSDGEFYENHEKQILFCKKCGFELNKKDNLIVFHSEKSGIHDGLNPCIYKDLLETQDRHFWINARIDFISRIFLKYANYNEKIIEVGGGTGNIAGELLKKGFKDVSVSDIHLNALEASESYPFANRYQFDITHAPFIKHFDIVGLFDVLEHVDNEDSTIKNIYKILKAGGRVIATVPAHMWLWSKNDRISSHRRRYEVDQLKGLFEKNGFQILKANSFFVSILPLLYLRKILQKDTGVITDSNYKQRFKINRVINFLLTKMLNIENIFSNFSPFKYGGSIILVAVKKE